MTISSLLRHGSSSLRNHIVLVFVLGSLPMAVMNGLFSYQDGELTPLRMLRISAVCAIGGLVVAFIGWFIILPPILRRSARKHD
jgi:hypothetical protein